MPNLETLVLWWFIRWETRIVRCRLVGKVQGVSGPPKATRKNYRFKVALSER